MPDSPETLTPANDTTDKPPVASHHSRIVSIRAWRALRQQGPVIVVSLIIIFAANHLWKCCGNVLGPTLHTWGEEICPIVGGLLFIYLFYNFGIVIFSMASPASDSPLFRYRLSHGVLVFAFIFAGFVIGGKYIHMCHAGSRLIENVTFFGTPLISGSILFLSDDILWAYYWPFSSSSPSG